MPGKKPGRMESFRQALLAVSLRDKLLFIVMGASSFALFLTFGMFMIYNSIELRSRLAETVEAVTKVLANRSTAALTYQDVTIGRDNLKALVARPSILLGCLYDSYGY